MPDQAPNIDVKPGDKGRLVYDKERRTIVAESPGTRQQLVDIERATKIVAEFEGIFGKLTATERRWLIRRLSGQEV